MLREITEIGLQELGLNSTFLRTPKKENSKVPSLPLSRALSELSAPL
jgi:hypothetical protein